MVHCPPSRWHLTQFASAVAVNLTVVSMLMLGHRTAAAAMAVAAVIQLAGIGWATMRRERDLRTLLAEASTDAVTGLPTRRLLYSHLAALSAETRVSVAYLDVDGLKPINDSLGHQAGDGLLAVVAQRLRDACIPGDVLVRLGGDEYALATGREQVEIARVLTHVNGDATIGDLRLQVRVSIGICRTGGGDPQFALGAAEAAMYTAKRRGSAIEHYEPTRHGPPRLVFPRPHPAGRYGAGLD